MKNVIQVAKRIKKLGSELNLHGWEHITDYIAYYKSTEGPTHYAVKFYGIQVDFFNDPKIEFKLSLYNRIDKYCEKANADLDRYIAMQDESLKVEAELNKQRRIEQLKKELEELS